MLKKTISHALNSVTTYTQNMVDLNCIFNMTEQKLASFGNPIDISTRDKATTSRARQQLKQPGCWILWIFKEQRGGRGEEIIFSDIEYQTLKGKAKEEDEGEEEMEENDDEDLDKIKRGEGEREEL